MKRWVEGAVDLIKCEDVVSEQMNYTPLKNFVLNFNPPKMALQGTGRDSKRKCRCEQSLNILLVSRPLAVYKSRNAKLMPFADVFILSSANKLCSLTLKLFVSAHGTFILVSGLIILSKCLTVKSCFKFSRCLLHEASLWL